MLKFSGECAWIWHSTVVREERFPAAVALTTCVRLLPPSFDSSFRYILARRCLITSVAVEAIPGGVS